MEDASTSPNSDAVPASRAAKIRKLLLFVLLGIMMVALLYDYRVARPAVAAAYDQITDESRKRNATPGMTFSNKDLSELLGKTPTKEYEDGTDLVEVYDYTSGIPGRPHRLFTVFKRNGDAKLFYRHAKFAFETRQDVAKIADLTQLQYTPEEAAIMVANMEADEAAARRAAGFPPTETDSSGQLTGQLTGQPTDRRDPEAMFAERDVNGDGKLDADEMPSRMSESLPEIDTDGDGSVSRAEIEQRMMQRRSQFGRGDDAGDSTEDAGENTVEADDNNAAE